MDLDEACPVMAVLLAGAGGGICPILFASLDFSRMLSGSPLRAVAGPLAP